MNLGICIFLGKLHSMNGMHYINDSERIPSQVLSCHMKLFVLMLFQLKSYDKYQIIPLMPDVSLEMITITRH